jgi:SAM-dependent methyltransferase
MRFNARVEHTVEVGHASATRPECDGVLHHQDDAMQPEARRMTNVRPAVDVFSDWATEGRDAGMERGHAAAVSEMLAFGLTRTAALGRGFRAIDVGCGNGWVVRQLAAVPFCSHAEGVDGAPGMIEKAKRVDPEGHYHHAMLPDWTPEGRFDLLVSMEVLYYLHDPAAMLATFRNTWLEPGGWAVVGVDHYAEHEDSLDWPEKVGVHMTTMTEAQWLEAWTEAGFEAIETWRAAGDPGTLVIAGRCPS